MIKYWYSSNPSAILSQGGRPLVGLLGLLVIALLTLAGCRSSDEEDSKPKPATPEQLKKIDDHWLAIVPLSGETDNWRSEEEGDKTAFDHVYVIIFMNTYFTEDSYWGYIYTKDGEMVNYDGIDRRNVDITFDFTMDSNGYIKPTWQLPDVPQVKTMRYDEAKDVITADVSYKGYSVSAVFNRVDQDDEFLNEFWMTLVDEGLLGYDDEGDELHTEVTDENADEPSRGRMMSIKH